MFKHANMGAAWRMEVMGLIEGKVFEDSFIIMDPFALPVEATQTGVNAGCDANIYIS